MDGVVRTVRGGSALKLLSAGRPVSFLSVALASFVTLAAQSFPAPQAPPTTPPPQQPTPTFRLSTRYVEVDAVVRDKEGRFIPGLTIDDFEVFEDNKRQTIDKVTLIDLPLAKDGASIAKPAITLAGLATSGNAAPSVEFATAERVYVMVLDSGSPDDVKRLAREFIDRHLGPSDLMAIVHVGRAKGQALTSNKELLRAAVERFRFNFSDDRLLSTLKEVAVSLGSITGRRRGIILFSQGFSGETSLWSVAPSGPEPFIDENMDSRWKKYHDMMRTARAFNVPIHGMFGSRMGVPMLARADERPGIQGRLPSLSTGDDSLADGAHSISMLVDHTGGVDLGNINGAGQRFEQLVEENSRYYMIGYYSNVERDGRNHPIVVRTTRPEVKVTARRGVEPRPMPDVKRVSLPSELSTAARSLLTGQADSDGIPVSTDASMFRGDDFMGAVLVSSIVEGRALDLRDGEKLRYTAVGIDATGSVIALDTRAFTLNVRPGTRSRIEQEGVQFLSRLALPPGTHTVRVLVEQPGRATGTASTKVTVPDFAASTLTFSDLNVGRREATAMAPLNDRRLRRELPAGLTRQRAFVRSEALHIFAEVYDVHWALVPQLEVRWTIQPAGSDDVIASGEERIESVFGGRTGFHGRVPLGRFQPGVYVLHAEAISTLGPPARATAKLQFIVLGEVPR